MSTASEFPVEPNTHEFKKLTSLKLSDVASMLRETIREWNLDRAQRLGASLAFYTLMSLAPLLVVTAALAALLFGKQAAEGELASAAQNLVGPAEAETIQAIIARAYQPAIGMLATIVSIITLAIGASSVAAELQDAMNTIWHIPANPNSSLLRTAATLLRERFLSLAVILGGGLLLLLSVAFSAWIAAVGRYFHSFLPIPEAALHGIVFLASFLVIAGILAGIYKILPDVPIAWSDVVIGACMSSLLFTIGKQLIAFYLGKVSFSSTYGAAGSLAAILVWTYYSAQLVFFGAEFSKVFARRVGSYARGKLTPKFRSVM